MCKERDGRARYPFLNAYGSDHVFLTTTQAVAADANGRIRSIWPFIVSRVMAFQETLKPRERINFDTEDTLSEVWIVLATKDDEWNPERGKYITYAGTIIDRELCAIRDKSRTVHAPRNSSGRLKEYRDEAKAGVLTARRRKTEGDIRRTGDGIGSIQAGSGREAEGSARRSPDPVREAIRAEKVAALRSVLRDAVRHLTPFEAMVLGRVAGLWGRAARSFFDIAWEGGFPEEAVRAAHHRAVSKVREHFVATGHPMAAHLILNSSEDEPCDPTQTSRRRPGHRRPRSTR